MLYAVTAQKPTSVQLAVKGNFTGPTDLNLIICKGTRIEIMLVTAEGLKPQFDFGIYGRITGMELYRPSNRSTDLLFLFTESLKFCILSYSPESGQIVTEANGDARDRTGKPSEYGPISLVDPSSRMIGLHLYQGVFKVIPIETAASGKMPAHLAASRLSRSKDVKYKVGDLHEAYNVRLEELIVHDMCFLHGCPRPTLAVLFEDAKQARHVRTYEFDLRAKDKINGPWQFDDVEPAANMLIPVPAPIGGILVVGEQTITYLSGQQDPVSLSMPLTVMKSYGRVDEEGKRYLLGDGLGTLYLLNLLEHGSRVENLEITQLGETSAASALVYIDNSVVFVGSHGGDSQLIRLRDRKGNDNSYVDILDTYTNLAPISDFCVVDLERQGQGQIITCSGIYKDGTLRVIRNGVGINDQAFLEMEGIKGVWSLRPTFNSEFEDTLVITFIGETRVLQLAGEEMQEVDEFYGFKMDEMTLAAANVLGDYIIQATPTCICLIDPKAQRPISEWRPREGLRINVASINPTQVVVACGAGLLVYLEIRSTELVQAGQTQLEHEIACLSINPFDSTHAHSSPLVAVGLWTDISVRLLRLPSLEPITKELLGGEIIPRSVLLASFEGIPYLFVGLGDGQLFSFVLDPKTGELRDRKKLMLGTQPIHLNTLKSNGATHVFVASDRPTVIYSNNQKLLYSNVNLREVSYLCPFNSPSFPNSLAITSEEGMTIGTIDEIQKLHITTIRLGELPRRICYQESTRTLGLLTTRMTLDDLSEDDQISFFKILDTQTFELLDAYQMDTYESIESIISLTFENDPQEYFVIGTAYAIPPDEEARRGRILVMQVTEQRQLKQAAVLELKGGVFDMKPMNGKLVAGNNNKVTVYKWEPTGIAESMTLAPVCTHYGFTLVCRLQTRGDFIVVADLMRSISLLLFRQQDQTLEEIARDYNTNWMRSVDALDDDTFVGTEESFNLFAVQRVPEVTSDEERRKLQVVGEFHLGEGVNRLRHGSLVMNLPETEALPAVPVLLYGTVNGALGVLAMVRDEDTFALLRQLEQNLTKVIQGIGGFDHKEWRSFRNERRTTEAFNILDGDLIESFLDLKRPEMEAVVAGEKGGVALGKSVEEVIKMVEELMRIH
ncbi:uncharacterized protein VTP21DRAFT_3402 [Calcarisporiella thermophila]|uniref:uncharacterized protein n=1 Tax=Calcarisporiella thermophila TaxID=911321 RepID=UPI0037446BA5